MLPGVPYQPNLFIRTSPFLLFPGPFKDYRSGTLLTGGSIIVILGDNINWFYSHISWIY